MATMQWVLNPNNAYYHTTSPLCVQASGMHYWLVHAYQYYGIGIDNRFIV